VIILQISIESAVHAVACSLANNLDCSKHLEVSRIKNLCTSTLSTFNRLNLSVLNKHL
jgi:hypothetical protein